jgi:hypothetical protein
MRQVAEFIAVLASALFTGAAVYITFVEHPAEDAVRSGSPNAATIGLHCLNGGTR